MDDLNRFMKSYELSLDMQLRLREYFQRTKHLQAHLRCTPVHALTRPHTPSHALTRPHTPSHALTRPYTPLHALTHPYTS